MGQRVDGTSIADSRTKHLIALAACYPYGLLLVWRSSLWSLKAKLLFSSPILACIALVLLSLLLAKLAGVRSPEYERSYSSGRIMAKDLEEMIRLNKERNLPMENAVQQLEDKKFNVRFVYKTLREVESNWLAISDEDIQKMGVLEYEKTLKQLQDGSQGFFDGFNENCSAFQLP